MDGRQPAQRPLGCIAARAAPLGPDLWPVVDQLPRLGRVFFGAHLRFARPRDPVLSGWHALNCIREWRWTLLGEAASVLFADDFEPPCEQLLARVDITAGPNYRPASRIHNGGT